jgi:predicted nuclease of predicted toxin-antitoxin system
LPGLRFARYGKSFLFGPGSMKGYLFDGNVPSRLRFSPKLPIIPLSNVSRNPSDSQIWDFARRNDLVIVSKDADFSDRIITSSPPPRVVHLRFGNLRRNKYHTMFARRWLQIESLLKTNKLINVYAERLEGIG